MGANPWISVFFCSLLLTVHIASGEDSYNQSQDVSRIAFGSCSNESASQPIWDAIIDFDPQVFVWLGDIVYGDKRRPFSVFGKERTIGPWKNAERFYPSSEEEMEEKYNKAKKNSGYYKLRKSSKVIGTWDDHDYGLNNAGKEFPDKVINQKLLLDFLDEPEASLRRKQEGVYASYVFGPKGKQVQVILLDTRYHRDPFQSDGTILGDAQWDWLEQELKYQSSEIVIIASSIQVISNISATVGPVMSMESWAHFPKERHRLFKLLNDTKRDGVFFISGDVHFGEICRHDCALGYPLYDITSSGLTQSIESALPSFFTNFIRFLAWFAPNTMRVMSKSCRFSSCIYGKPNFGAIVINWNASPVTVELELRDVDGRPVAGVDVMLSELRWGSDAVFVNTVPGTTKRHCTDEIDLPWIVRNRIAIFFFSLLSVLVLGVGLAALSLILLCRMCYIRKFKVE